MAKRTSEPESISETPTQEYTVVARRYRPQQFDQLIGQESTAQALINALTGSRVAHAYLFTGARGVGKTSCARILAKALNCEKGPTPTPCDECEICKGIISGDDVDVLEIDGASNNKVDEIRELRGNVAFRPSRARYKIYIIDEVHMLTTAAFNALLKTLEEPPPHVKFIFATTETSKIPVTILSRCQRFDFGMIRPASIAKHLHAIVKQEQREADDAAIDQIARRAAGSMRDAESLLDQLLSFGEPVTSELVHKLIGTAPAERVAAMATAIFGRDTKAAIDIFAAALREGSQAGELLDQLIEFWRDLMLASSCGADAPGLVNPAEVVKSIASTSTLDVVMAGLDVLTISKARLKFTSHGALLVEMAIVRLSRLDQLFTVGDMWSLMQQGGSASSNVANPRPISGAAPAPSSSFDEKKKDDESGSNSIALTDESAQLVWQEVLKSLGPMLAGDLSKAGLLAISAPNTVVVRFPAGYNRQYATCVETGRQQKIHDAFRRVTGVTWTVRLEVAPDLLPARTDSVPVEVATTSVATPPDPLIEAIKASLEARVMRIDDGFGIVATVSVPDDETPWAAIEEE